MHWKLSHRYGRRARELADRHYNRRAVGSPQFLPPGVPLVLVSTADDAVWASLQQRYVLHEWPGAWGNPIFRKEGPQLASDMIRDAIAATLWQWGPPPAEGLITFVDPSQVRRKRDPGRCYLRAGFRLIGETKGGHGRNPLLVFGISPADMPDPEAPIRRQLPLFDAVRLRL